LALVPRKIGGKEAVATTRPHQSLFRDISHVTLPLSHPDVMSGLHITRRKTLALDCGATHGGRGS
jgi:hypothetical protein